MRFDVDFLANVDINFILLEKYFSASLALTQWYQCGQANMKFQKKK
jgi:hypothetical protein